MAVQSGIVKGRSFDRVTAFGQRFEGKDAICRAVIGGVEKRNVPDK